MWQLKTIVFLKWCLIHVVVLSHFVVILATVLLTIIMMNVNVLSVTYLLPQ
jgi:hypothetical protein